MEATGLASFFASSYAAGWVWAGAVAARANTARVFRDKDEESIEMTTRLNFMHDLFRNTAGNVIEVSPKGKSQLAKMMYLMCLGDFASCYLAILRGIDPSPVDIITELKRRLADK